MAISTVGQLILFLHRRAMAEGRLQESDALASQIIKVLGNEAVRPKRRFYDLPLGVQVGLELRQGRIFSDEARAIRQAAVTRLRDYEFFLAAVDEIGYTPQLVRAALSVHFGRLEHEVAGSGGNCIFIDLQAARSVAPEGVRQVVDLLPSYGPQEAGLILKTNGSRAVGRAVAILSKILEGKWNGKSRRRRRRKGTIK